MLEMILENGHDQSSGSSVWPLSLFAPGCAPDLSREHSIGSLRARWNSSMA